jgi:hypothetical protein
LEIFLQNFALCNAVFCAASYTSLPTEPSEQIVEQRLNLSRS